MSDVHIVEHQSAVNLPGNPPGGSTHHHQPLPLPPQPSLHFVHFTSDRISSLLQQVCELLGCHGSPPVIVDHLLEKLRLSPSTHGKELLLILSHVLLGAASRRESERGRESGKSADEMFVLVEGLLEELVVPGNWDRSQPAVLDFDVGGGESFWREEGVTSTKVSEEYTIIILFEFCYFLLLLRTPVCTVASSCTLCRCVSISSAPPSNLSCRRSSTLSSSALAMSMFP